MPKRSSHKVGSELFIVDNSAEDWKAVRYLRDWCQLSKSIDIAAGFFEVGALLALDGEWQKLDGMRILMGDQVSRRTRTAFERALQNLNNQLDQSLEGEKLKNHFLKGVQSIVEALKSGKIACRVYRKDKFHAKAYITHAKLDVVGSSALVGSSNFTVPGLTQNVELNVQITGTPVAVLQEWYDEHWEEAEDVTPEILRVFEKHARNYTPFEVYARSLQQYFLKHEESTGEWEKNSSRIFPIHELHNTTVGSALAIAAQLPNLYDQIYCDFPEAYNDGGAARFGRLSSVKMAKDMRSKPHSPFTKTPVAYSYPDGFIMPLVYGLKALMRKRDDGKVEWTVDDPAKFLDENLTTIVRKYRVIIEAFAGDPQKIGKNEGSYSLAADAFETELLKLTQAA